MTAVAVSGYRCIRFIPFVFISVPMTRFFPRHSVSIMRENRIFIKSPVFTGMNNARLQTTVKNIKSTSIYERMFESSERLQNWNREQ